MSQRTNEYQIRRAWLFIFLAIMIVFTTTDTYGGNKKMEQQPLYDFKDALTVEPQIYKINRATSLSLFPVPFDNAVGTNSLNNAITILSFPHGKLQEDRYFKNVVDDIRGSGVYLPVISKAKIGFALGRLFLLFNFKTDTAKLYRLVFSIGKTPEKMAIADADRNRFLVEVESMNDRSNDPWDVKKYLQLFELKDKEVALLKEIHKPAGSIWSTAYNRLFLWNITEETMLVYDMNLENNHHPLEDIIKRNKGKIRFNRLEAHPILPFAVLSGGRYGAMFVSWKEGRTKTPLFLFGDAQQFSFSPDGKWLVFKDDLTDPARTYLMPVSEKYPHFLGTPILLINRPFSADTFAWTNNPTSFVASGAKDLYRWELTNEAQRSMMGSDADKYPSFHDYIVAKDLEKLTREKKQGLGK